MKFTFLDNARETYDASQPLVILTLEDQPQESDRYYCGLCKAFMPISHFPHGTGQEVK